MAASTPASAAPSVMSGGLTGLPAEAAAALYAATADLTFVVASDGAITSAVHTAPDFPSELVKDWRGRNFADIATIESRPKISDLLRDLSTGTAPRWRQINLPTRDGVDLPVRCIILRAGSEGQGVVVGQDTRPLATMQQKLVAAELAVEQDYFRLRHAETRFRLLMQVASEVFLVIDGRTGRIVEANPAASALLEKPLKRLIGSPFEDHFNGSDREMVETMRASLAASGRAEETALTLGGQKRQAIASGTAFRENNTVHYLIRLLPLAAGGGGIVVPRAKSLTLKALEASPDAFVVVDGDRRIVAVNAAFLEAAQLGSEEQARGEPLDRWIGRAGVDVSLLFDTLSAQGSVRQFQTILRGQFGTTEDVEISASAVPDSDPPCFGIGIRRAGRRATTEGAGRDTLLRSVDEMTKLVGKVPLKDLVREATDIIERLCIEAALQLNDNNRASSAEMLGLSRQSLYVKLHRHGIEDKGALDDND